jgi:hypothetical protein
MNSAQAVVTREESASNTEMGLMDEKQFLKRINRCRASLHQLKKKGLVSYLKSGRRTLYDEQSYQDFLNNCTMRIVASNAPKTRVIGRSSRRGLRRGARRRATPSGSK